MSRARLGAWCVALALGASFLVSVTPAHAIEIRVSGQARLVADIQPAGTSLQIAGTLRDEIGQPLPQRDLSLTIEAAISDRPLVQQTLTTDMQGRFTFQQEFDEGDVRVKLAFAPTDHLDGSVIERELLLQAVAPKLDLQAPKLVVGDHEPALLRLRASADGVGVRAPIQIVVGDVQVDQVELDHYGRGVFDLAPYLVAGENVIFARLEASPRRPEASDRVQVRFAQHATLVATLEPAYQRLERGLRVIGRVSDALGPLPSGRVTVTFEHAPLHADSPLEDYLRREGDLEQEPLPLPFTPLSDVVRGEVEPSGRFELFLPGHLIEDGDWRAQITYRPDAGPASALLTDTIRLDRSSSRWLLNILGLLGILIGFAVLAWRLSLVDIDALLDVVRGARRGKKSKEVVSFEQDEPIVVEQLEPLDDGLPPSDRRIGGVVWDVWRKRPVPFARIELSQHAELLHTYAAMSDGRFQIEELAHGSWFMRVTAPGFAPGTLEFELPHGGDLAHFRLGLVAIPLKIRRYYQVWVQRIHGQDLWGTLSPRQIEGALWSALEETEPLLADEAERRELVARIDSLLEASHARHDFEPERLLLSVTQIVEDAYFSSHQHDEELWHLLVALTQRLDALLDTRRNAPPLPSLDGGGER